MSKLKPNSIFCILAILLMCITSCNIFKPSLMLRTGPNYDYNIAPDSVQSEYKIACNDRLSFRIFSNDGFQLIDLTNFTSSNKESMTSSFDYLVEHDGVVKLPIIGRIKLAGMTLRKAERLLEETYAEFYKKPFVMLNATNKRVIVFPGTEGAAQVIALKNNNTTLIEALAISGGISGKANKIKLIRGNPINPEVFLIDLSTIKGMEQGGMVLQANDIIYIDPLIKPAETVLNILNPYLSIITTIILIISMTQTP